ncbi:MAG TPA: thioredoxin family protein [Marmoricola sp.]|nr:thioredoxin family protein [Marmoricola sp.]
MTTGAWVLLGSVVLAVGFGLWRAVRDGRFSGTHRLPEVDEDPHPAVAGVLAGTSLVDGLGSTATLLQFSSAFCAPCRTTRVVLADVASRHPGITHLEVDAEQHLELVRRLGISRTPTTLVLDVQGVELTRAMGAPRREAVERSLHALGLIK